MINRAFADAIRITVALVGGVGFAWLCSCEAVFGGASLMNFIHAWLLPLQQDSDVVYRGRLGDLYVRFDWVVLVLAAGTSAIYSIIWFLNAGAVAKSAAQVHGARPSWISVVAALVSAAFAILTARQKNEIPKSEPQLRNSPE
ncbi:MAG TPA: hypothetical protein VK673_00650 [Chthoniobacterales bacterium]|nr:hypothetical protein [Chthoniobacterales bacterium]